MTNFEKFIEIAQEFTVNGIPEGKSCDTIEKEAASYFGMSISDYRKTLSSALKARRAQQTFEIRYYLGTHPHATASSAAVALCLPEVQVKAVIDTK